MKQPVLICHRRLVKIFNELAFLHELASVNWYRISLIPSVKDAWTFFFDILSGIVKKHTLKKIRIKKQVQPLVRP